MTMRLRSRRPLRARSALPEDYIEPYEPESELELGSELEPEHNHPDGDDDDNDNEINDIPEVNINDLINLANQLVQVNPGPDLQLNFPRIASINEARDIILDFERQQENRNIVWDSIRQDEQGVSISGRRITSEETHHHDEEPEISNRQPVWLELAGLITVTMFMFAVYRLITALVAISAFSDNVFGDVFEFVELVNNNTAVDIEQSTLVLKFANVVRKEMPFLPDTLWLGVTVSLFSMYTVFTSGVVLTSMMFAAMCFSMCFVVRWRHLADFFMKIIEE